MTKIFNMLFFFIIFLNASIIDDYKEKKYKSVCNFKNFLKYKKNENILSLIGEACIKTDNLYMLPYIIRHLKYTPVARRNAIYFLVVYNEKRLLYSFLFDNFNISGFDFPETDYILSVVFEAVKNKKYKKKDKFFLIKNGKKTVKMYKENDKMVIEEFDGKKIKRHWFR